MKRFALLLVLVAACKPTPQPAPAPASQAATVWNELVEAGCVAPDDGGPQSVADEYALKLDGDAWLACMWAGGSVASCHAPCE